MMKRQTVTTFALTLTTTTEDCIVGIALKCLYAANGKMCIRDRDFLTMKKIYDEGTLGPVFNIETRVHGSRGIPGDWRNAKVHGGGMVLDWGVHMLDQIMMMVEKPLRSVYAILSHVTNDDVDDGFKIFLDFEGGLNVQVEVGTSNFINLDVYKRQILMFLVIHAKAFFSNQGGFLSQPVRLGYGISCKGVKGN